MLQNDSKCDSMIVFLGITCKIGLFLVSLQYGMNIEKC